MAPKESVYTMYTFDSTSLHKTSTYRKNPKISDTLKFILISLKVEQDGVSLA